MWSNDIELKSEKYSKFELVSLLRFPRFCKMQGLKTQGYENEGIGKCRDENAGNGIPEIKPQGWVPSVIICIPFY